MNPWFRGKIAVLVVLIGIPFWAWFTEDTMHLGLYPWFEKTFGNQIGIIAWIIFWYLVFYASWRVIKAISKSQKQ